jgi:hypothetical protein
LSSCTSGWLGPKGLSRNEGRTGFKPTGGALAPGLTAAGEEKPVFFVFGGDQSLTEISNSRASGLLRRVTISLRVIFPPGQRTQTRVGVCGTARTCTALSWDQ